MFLAALVCSLLVSGISGILISRDNEGFVVGGGNASKGEFPFQAHITWDGVHYCQGTILTKDWILTAGGCIDSRRGPSPTFRVIGGEHDIMEDDGTEQIVNASKFITHKNYTRSNIWPNYDIGVIRLATPLKFDKFVQPVTLWTQKDGPIPKVDLSLSLGWGMTEYPDGEFSSFLQKGVIPILDLKVCKETGLGKRGLVKEPMMCAGPNETGGKGMCYGDKGAPLLIQKDNVWKQVGIYSWNTKSCGIAKHPAIFSDTLKFIDFIREHVPEYFEQH